MKCSTCEKQLTSGENEMCLKLSCINMPCYENSPTCDIYFPPEFEGNRYFCDLKCLSGWDKK